MMDFFLKIKKLLHFTPYGLIFFLCTPFFCWNLACSKEITSVRGDMSKPVVISSSKISSWKSDDYRVFVCTDNVRIGRGEAEIQADECVCWFYEEKALQADEATVDVYFGGNVSMLNKGVAEKHDQLFLRLASTTGVVIEAGQGGVDSFEEEQQTDLLNRANAIKFEASKSLGGRKGTSAESPGFSIPASDDAIKVFADEVDSWVDGDDRIVTAIGNVKIKRGEMALNADNVILRFDNKGGGKFSMTADDFTEMYAEGNVSLRQEDDVQLADKIFMNYKEDKGLLVNGEINVSFSQEEGIVPSGSNYKSSSLPGKIDREHSHEEDAITAHIKGEEIKISGKGQYEIKNGFFTTCGFNHPHFKFGSSKIRIISRQDQTVVSLAGNRIFWGKRPIFYWPYLSFDVRSNPGVLEDWETGNSSRFGSFLTTDWNLFNLGFAGDVAKWSTLRASLDYLEKRGPGVGLNYEYEKGNSSGLADVYYMKDKKDEELNSEPVQGEDRWRLSWRHRQMLPYHMRLDIEANNLSDDNILREFYEKVYKEAKDEETVLYLRFLEDNHSGTFLIKKQLNSFDTFVDAGKMDRVAERLPELSYKIIGEPMLNGRFNYTTENTFTYFDRLFSSDIGVQNPDPGSTTRFDSNSEISAPFKFSIFKVKPFARARLLSYSDSVDNRNDPSGFDNNGSRLERFISTLGVDVSTTMWRTYSVYNRMFNINRLRHVFTPEFRYSANPSVGHDPSEINQFDSVDAINDSQWLLIGLRNKLQTKRGRPGNEKIEDLIYFDVELNFFIGEEGEGSSFNNDIVFNNRREDFIQFDFKAKVNDHITIVSMHNEFNLSNSNMEIFNFGVEVNYDDKLSGFLGQRYIDGISSSLLFSANYSLSDKWGVGFFEQFDFRAREGIDEEDFDEDRDLGRNLKTKLVLTRYFHEWIGSFTTEFNPVRDETTTRFDVFPRALKKKEKPGRFWF